VHPRFGKIHCIDDDYEDQIGKGLAGATFRQFRIDVITRTKSGKDSQRPSLQTHRQACLALGYGDSQQIARTPLF
jgi:hypothetical protein